MPKNNTHELTVQNLYAALLQLMERKPYKEISVTELVKTAGVSRMAFYRNYQDKSEILTDHLREIMCSYQERCHRIEHITEKSLWIEFFREMRSDPIFLYLRRAELMDAAIDLQKYYAEDIYVTLLHWDMDRKENRMVLYQRIGSMMGLLLYLADWPEEANEMHLASQVVSFLSADNRAADN